MDEQHNRMATGKNRGRKRGRPPTTYRQATQQPAEDGAPQTVQCGRCGRIERQRIKKTNEHGKFHWCTGCGEWLIIRQL